MKQEERIKPCPFCAGGAKITTVDCDDGFSFWRVTCSNPLCLCFNARLYGTKESAVKDWNKRPLYEKLEAEIVRLREALEHVVTTDTTVDKYGIWRIDGKTFQTWAADVLKRG